jgi:hypothetical protein
VPFELPSGADNVCGAALAFRSSRHCLLQAVATKQYLCRAVAAARCSVKSRLFVAGHFISQFDGLA